MSSKISHSGVIESIADGCVKVRILQTSACAGCKVAAHCNASESKVKMVDVACADGTGYHKGQQVVVSTSLGVANRALILGFGLPLLLPVSVLVGVLFLTSREGVAALSAIGVLIPYYIILWFLRDSVSRRVSFQLEVA